MENIINDKYDKNQITWLDIIFIFIIDKIVPKDKNRIKPNNKLNLSLKLLLK